MVLGVGDDMVWVGSLWDGSDEFVVLRCVCLCVNIMIIMRYDRKIYFSKGIFVNLFCILLLVNMDFVVVGWDGNVCYKGVWVVYKGINKRNIWVLFGLKVMLVRGLKESWNIFGVDIVGKRED